LRAAQFPALRKLRQKATLDVDHALVDLLLKRGVALTEGTPFQAQPAPPIFVGRSSEIATVRSALLNSHQVAICSVQGMGGVGKTALATRLVYEMRDYFPDGVLWARPDVSDTLSILALFAEAFGKDVRHHQDIATRSAAVRDLLANKRVLIVLDNAESNDQIESLLPPSTGRSAVLVTTRSDLTCLDGWTQLWLDGFDARTDESYQLFERFLGREIVQRHRDVLGQIGQQLGLLPYALTLAAGQLAALTRGHSRYETSATQKQSAILHTFLAEISEQGRKLPQLQRGTASLRTSFAWGYDRLSVALQTTFASLGVYSGVDFSLDAVAAVLSLDEADALDHINQLMQRSFVFSSQESRFRLHPLMHEFARELLLVNPDDYVTRMTRAIDHYAHFAEQHIGKTGSVPVDWSNILGFLRLDFEAPFVVPLLKLCDSIRPHLELSGQFQFAKLLFERACRAAQQLGDDLWLAKSLRGLAGVLIRLADYDGATAMGQQGIGIAEKLNNDELRLAFLKVLGTAYFGRGRFAETIPYGRAALDLARKMNHKEMIANALINLGTTIHQLGDNEQAQQFLNEGLDMAALVGDHESQLVAINNLSSFAFAEGDYQSVLMLLTQGVVLARQVNIRERLALLLCNQGNAQSLLGFLAEAQTTLNEALTLAEDLAMPWMISLAECTRADHLVRAGDVQAAEYAAKRALQLGQKIASTQMTANALFSLARINILRGDRDEAIRLAEESQHLFAANQPSRATEVSVWLRTVFES
jgi:tetratricopeptide (TPR) repeat protein